MMLKRTAAVLLAAMAVSAAAAVTSFGGEWKLDAGKYWYDTGSSYLANGIHAIEGVFYSFDPSGYMETGWQDEGGKWYYFDPASGAQVRGWLQVGDKWYYLDPMDGAMRTGIVEILNKLYYFNPDGAMHAPGIFHSEDGTKTYRARMWICKTIIRSVTTRTASCTQPTNIPGWSLKPAERNSERS